MKELDRMVKGHFYKSNDLGLLRLRIRARCLADRYNRTRAWQLLTRLRLIKRLFPNGSKGAYFEPTIRVEYGFNVKFGKNFFMNFDCKLLDVSPIEIGDGVMFGPNVVIATPFHPMVADERIIQDYGDGTYDLEYSQPIKIGNNVWIASSVTVCGGVTIGDNTVIGAGSVVTKDIPSGVFAAGVPCKVIREITEKDRLYPPKLYAEDLPIK